MTEPTAEQLPVARVDTELGTELAPRVALPPHFRHLAADLGELVRDTRYLEFTGVRADVSTVMHAGVELRGATAAEALRAAAAMAEVAKGMEIRSVGWAQIADDDYCLTLYVSYPGAAGYVGDGPTNLAKPPTPD